MPEDRLGEDSAAERTVLEIQVHPGSVRQPTRCLFLTRRDLRRWSAVAVVLGLIVLLGCWRCLGA